MLAVDSTLCIKLVRWNIFLTERYDLILNLMIIKLKKTPVIYLF